jgi:chemotaxis response regulator CheB
VLKCILIVDDSAVMRRAIRLFLQSRPGLEVCGEAVDGIEAIAKAEELKPDLIVLDFSMPKMNGLEAAAALQKIMPTVPIILYTFHKDAVSSDRAHHAEKFRKLEFGDGKEIDDRKDSDSIHDNQHYEPCRPAPSARTPQGEPFPKTFPDDQEWMGGRARAHECRVVSRGRSNY